MTSRGLGPTIWAFYPRSFSRCWCMLAPRNLQLFSNSSGVLQKQLPQLSCCKKSAYFCLTNKLEVEFSKNIEIFFADVYGTMTYTPEEARRFREEVRRPISTNVEGSIARKRLQDVDVSLLSYLYSFHIDF